MNHATPSFGHRSCQTGLPDLGNGVDMEGSAALDAAKPPGREEPHAAVGLRVPPGGYPRRGALVARPRYGDDAKVLAGRAEPDPDDEAPVRGARASRSTSTGSPGSTGSRNATARCGSAPWSGTTSLGRVRRDHGAATRRSRRRRRRSPTRSCGTSGRSAARSATPTPPATSRSVMLALGASRRAHEARAASARSRSASSSWTRSRRAPSPTSCSPRSACRRRPPSSGGTYLKLERKVGDCATVGVAVALSLVERLDRPRRASGSPASGSKNIKATDAEEALAGAEPTDEAFAEAGRLAAAAASPSADVRGTAEYKRHMVEVYVRRGLARRATPRAAA